MNNEVASFYIEFVTKGLAELKEGLDDINGKIDDLGSNMQGSGGKSDGLGSKLLGLAAAFGLVTSAAAAATAAISKAFNVAESALELRNLSITSGESAKNIETLGLMLERYGGDINDAAQVYQSMNEIAYQMATWGNVTEDQQRLVSRYHEYGLELTPGMSADQILMAFQRTFYNLRNSGRDEGWIASAINDIASGFGISSQPMIILLQQSIEDLIDEQERVREMLVLSNEGVQENSDELFESKQELRQVWAELSANLIPVLTEALKILTSILELLGPILEVLGPIAEWALTQIGEAVEYSVDAIAQQIEDVTIMGKSLTGEIPEDEGLKQLYKDGTWFTQIGLWAGGKVTGFEEEDLYPKDPNLGLAYLKEIDAAAEKVGLSAVSSQVFNSEAHENVVQIDLVLPSGQRVPYATVHQDGSLDVISPNMLMGGVL